MKSNDIFLAITGLPRHLHMLKQQIHELKNHNKVSKNKIVPIYFIREDLIDDNFQYFLNELDVKIQIIPKIDKRTLMALDSKYGTRVDTTRVNGGLAKASLWKQLIDIRSVLGLLPKDAYVIRTRTDILIRGKELLRISNLDWIEKRRHSVDCKISERIHILWASTTIPFYMHDVVFSGKVSELVKFINNENFDTLAPHYPPYAFPSFFWIGPFLHHKDIENWLKKFNSSRPKMRYMKDLKFATTYNLYYQILFENFYIDSLNVEWCLSFAPYDGIIVKRIWKRYNFRYGLFFHLICFKFKYSIGAIESDIELTRFFEKNETYISSLHLLNSLKSRLLSLNIFGR